MNERIKELADKAFAHFTNTNTWSTSNEFCEKFAELIIRECANAIIKDSRLNDVRSAANGCVRTINEHFGVEQ